MSNQLISDVIHFLHSDQDHIWDELIEIIDLVHKLNPYIGNDVNEYMWNEQCGINVPLMYISSIYLYTHAKKHGIDTFLFATRDCCHWIEIFKKLFPNEHCVYFNCSRNMLDGATKTDNKYYDEYVKKCIKTDVTKAIFVDIHGTGKRAFSYFENKYGDGQVPYNFLLSSSYRHYGEFPTITQKYYEGGKFLNLIFDARGSPIEMLNYDIQGTLQKYNHKGTVRDPPEYDLKYLEAYHVCVKYMCKHINSFKSDREIKLDSLYKIIQKIYRVIQDNKPAISVNIKHPVKHPKLEDGDTRS
jgi:hypothetical protein